MRVPFLLLAAGAALGCGGAWAQVAGRAEAPQITPVEKGAAAISIPEVPAGATERAAPEQLAHGGRTAEAPAPLSTVREGREVGVQRVGGHDRCDPTATGPAPQGCDRIFERRSAEFARPGPAPVSPEARLLILSSPPAAPSDARTAARDLGAGAVSDQLAAEAIAASTTQPPPAVVTGGSGVPGSAGAGVTVVVPPR